MCPIRFAVKCQALDLEAITELLNETAELNETLLQTGQCMEQHLKTMIKIQQARLLVSMISSLDSGHCGTRPAPYSIEPPQPQGK